MRSGGISLYPRRNLAPHSGARSSSPLHRAVVEGRITHMASRSALIDGVIALGMAVEAAERRPAQVHARVALKAQESA